MGMGLTTQSEKIYSYETSRGYAGGENPYRVEEPENKKLLA
jgi:hypothetical protein